MINRLIWTLGWFIGFTFPAHATVTITGITAGTYSELSGTIPAASGTGLVVYGGMAGPSTNCTDINSVCDSCLNLAAGDLSACNAKRIHGTLRLVISFTSDKVDGVPIAAKDDTTSPTKLTMATDSPIGIITKGNAGYIIVPWDSICGALTAKDGQAISSCPTLISDNGATGLTGKIRIGFDSGTADSKLDTNDDYATVDSVVQRRFGENSTDSKSYTEDVGSTYTGAFHFEARPGDTKVTIVKLLSTSLPQIGDSYTGSAQAYATLAKAVRIYFLETNDTTFTASRFNTIGPRSNGDNAVSYRDLSISTTTTSGTTEVSVSQPTVDSLANSTSSDVKSYYFKSAIVDQAGNIGFFTAPVGTANYSTDTYCAYTDTYAANASYQECHWAKPGEVLGVLANNVNCFIATAAYGSPFAKHVDDLRQFRDRFLITTAWGEAFVDWYYEHSPKAARWIAERPVVRGAVRVALWPAWAFAFLSLHFGLWGATLIYIVGIAFLTVFSIFTFRSFVDRRRRA